MQPCLKRNITLLALLAILLALFSPAYGQAQGGGEPAPPTPLPLGQDLRFDHFTSEDGLSTNRVVPILQDNQGFMWLGTFDGLNRYDGYEFKVYRHNSQDQYSLGANLIVELYQDPEGYIWVGTSGGGLNRYDPLTERFTRYMFDPSDPNSLGNNVVLALLQDRQGVLWVGTDGGGLNRYDPATDGFIRYQNDPDDPYSLSDNVVWSIFEDAQGTLWVGTDRGGLNRFDRQTGQFTAFRHDPDDPNSLAQGRVTALYQDQEGVMWLGTFGGLDYLGPETGGFNHYRHDPEDPHSLSHNFVTDILGDDAGNLWVSTMGGLNRFDRRQGSFVRYLADPNNPDSLSHNSTSALYEDTSGLLWIATLGGGVNKLDLNAKPFTQVCDTLSKLFIAGSHDVREIYEDQNGVLWIGTTEGLIGFNCQDEIVSHYTQDVDDLQSLSHNVVRAIVQDQNGLLWLGTQGGLDRFDPRTQEFTTYRADPSDPEGLLSDAMWSAYLDSQGMLWVGTSLGLNQIDPRSEQFTAAYRSDPDDPHSLSGNTVTAIHEDQDGVLWIGTLGDGLNRFDKETGRFTVYRHDPDDPQSLGENSIWAVYEDSAGRLWIGTGAGLDRFNRASGEFVHYGEQSGLPGVSVAGILEDDGPPTEGGLGEQDGANLWISTSSGLYRYDPKTDTARHYDVKDGLPGDNFSLHSAFKSASGKLFFGSTNGLAAFYPAQIQDNPHIPPVVLTDFQLANKPVEIGDESVLQAAIPEAEHLTLSHQDRVISFEFAALDYRSPNKNRYRYTLEGFDEDWTEVGSDRRFVTYTNLDPGEYTFRVLGSNSDGVWNEEGTSLGLTITPPWWGTTWFRGLFLVVVIAGVYGAYRWRVGSLETQRRELETQVGEKTHELSERVKELDCLYGISGLAGTQGISLEEILGGAVGLIPPAWRYPEIAGARVVLEGQEYRTDNFAETAWRQSASIRIHGEQVGSVEVCYLEERAERDEGPFLKDERSLLDAVAERLGRIVERLRAEQDLRRTSDELATLLAVSQDVTSTLDLEPLLNLTLDHLKQVVDYDVATIRRLVQGNMELQAHRWLFPQEGRPSQHLPVATIPIIREMVQTRQAILVADHQFNPRIVGDTELLNGILTGEVLQASRTLMCVPLVVKGEVIGMLVLGHHQPNCWREEEKELVQAFANQAAVAIANAELYEKASKTATLEERTRLARELHDSATQALYSATLFSEAGRVLAQAGDLESAQHYLSRVGDAVHQALKDMRVLIFQLRPPVLEKEGLVGALEQRLNAVEKRAGIRARLITDEVSPLSDSVTDGLYHIALAALNNALKHAEADAVTVTIRSDGETMTLEVVDDGHGFDPQAVQDGGGMGLVSMRERAAKLGADLVIDSAPGEGTRVRVSVGTRGSS